MTLATAPAASRTTSSADPAAASVLDPSDVFAPRHLGPSEADVGAMLQAIGLSSLDELADQTVPEAIRLRRPLNLAGLPDRPRGEHEVLEELRKLASQNRVLTSCIGQGYHDTITPPVIQRNILENPGWYTQYTPYQAEISQGRLEALMNFQTMVADLTALPLANASMLDEATAAAEAMAMARSLVEDPAKPAFFVAADCHPQTIAVVRTRGKGLGIELVVAPLAQLAAQVGQCFGVLLQYPTTDGRVVDYTDTITAMHAAGGMAIVAADVLALTLLKPPGEMGADIAVGSTQRFGVPMGFGGPHAAYMATKAEYARKMPGRLIGLSRDAHGKPAYRLTLQTREQHIRREKATSNICTAQVLLAIMAGMYAVYHGPEGLKRIARRVHGFTAALAEGLRKLGHDVGADPFFDTLRVRLAAPGVADQVIAAAQQRGINLRRYEDASVGASLDETTTREDVVGILESFAEPSPGTAIPGRSQDGSLHLEPLLNGHRKDEASFPLTLARRTPFLTHPTFNRYHSETELLRYIFKLQGRDLSLAQSMIPLGSCTMKLNATSEMLPVTWPEFGRLHPFAPAEQARGYRQLFDQLERWLAEVTGFAAVSLQPNAGSQGEYAGLMVIRAYHAARGEGHRDACLIPTSAHGTNPASAAIAGLRVVAVACDAMGNVDVADLRKKASDHTDRLACLMITYPSTHGVFEAGVREICQVAHEFGGQVYMDGANMNAQVGLCRPGDIGADVCHLNLHKTFCIPHGGGGPGMGPIGVAEHLAGYLPGSKHLGPVSAAPHGSPSILPISWVYIALMGPAGLTKATQLAILNANYMAARLRDHFPILYRGGQGMVAHECILDCRGFQQGGGVLVEDIAKR
ncbi:MAG TPA: aminomethyl-transferring glycine dehydrogenase, partial [Tepidisphaeraceae bacterium]|nr:aminomethyl-transferring glycine dehydrogenase [Tepidisphaeraceae bacterium]